MKITWWSAKLNPSNSVIEKVPVMAGGRSIGHVAVTDQGQFAAVTYRPSGKEVFVRMGTSLDDAASAVLDAHHDEERL
jgi:hypothetical protein